MTSTRMTMILREAASPRVGAVSSWWRLAALITGSEQPGNSLRFPSFSRRAIHRWRRTMRLRIWMFNSKPSRFGASEIIRKAMNWRTIGITANDWGAGLARKGSPVRLEDNKADRSSLAGMQ